MNLEILSDSNLVQNTERLVREECALLARILQHLREIERRRLFSDLGYKSLFDFTVRHLGYPEDQAYRRISAMRLLREIPEIEAKVESGVISLTHIGLAQALFKFELKFHDRRMSHHEKRTVFDRIAGKPVREAQRITLSMRSSEVAAKPDRITQVSDGLVEFKFVASIELQVKIENLKGLLAHERPNISLGEIFEMVCDLGLAEWDPGRVTGAGGKKNSGNARNSNRDTSSEGELSSCWRRDLLKTGNSKKRSDRSTAASSQEQPALLSTPQSKRSSSAKTAAPRKWRVISITPVRADINPPLVSVYSSNLRRPVETVDHLPQAVAQLLAPSVGKGRVPSKSRMLKAVYQKAGNRCEKCKSTYALEIDHVIPKAKGGRSTPENLRLLCRNCNQRAAIQEFGQRVMDQYIN